VLDVQTLADVDLFRTLPDEALGRLVESATERTLRRGDVVFDEDDDAAELFVVERGREAIANRSSDGRESVVALMEAGDLFGDMAMFDGGGRSAQARALEASVIHAIPYAAIRAELNANPTLLWSVVELLVTRIRSMDNALADAVFLDVTGRTAKRLLELAGDADEFQLPVTQEELAGLVGASRERVNKALASFIRLGWISQHDRRYRIDDREQLRRRSR
jgi:CRP/FNR family cyclic AMP-dependent transcriptional regulator